MLNFVIRGCTCRLYEGGRLHTSNILSSSMTSHRIWADSRNRTATCPQLSVYTSIWEYIWTLRVQLSPGLHLHFINKFKSAIAPVTHDISQGLVLGPLLFILNILLYLGHTTTWSHAGIITVMAPFIDPKNSINFSMYTILIHTHSRDVHWLPAKLQNICKIFLTSSNN